MEQPFFKLYTGIWCNFDCKNWLHMIYDPLRQGLLYESNASLVESMVTKERKL